MNQRPPHFIKSCFQAALLLFLAGLPSCNCEGEAYVRSTPAMIVLNTEMIDFGTIPLGGEVTRQLTILNTGSSPLTIDTINIEAEDAPFNTLSQEQSIAAAGETVLPVQFFPIATGEFEGELHILSNASNKSEAVVLLRGSAYDATICGPCDDPPEPICLDENNSLIYEYTGSCVDGSCLYEGQVVPCPYGCDEATGRCLLPECTEDADCSDGRFCTGEETCNTESGHCEYGDTPCDMEAPICDEDLDLCIQCRYAADCDDAAFCNGEEVCTSEYRCAGGPNPCSEGTPICIETTEQCVACLANAECDDNVYCNGAEICNVDGICAPGPYPCSEERPYCDENQDLCGECLGDADCSNMLFCDGQEVCTDELNCIPGQPPCGTLNCDEANGVCGECTNDTQCNDLLFCNGEEICDPDDLICQAGTPPCTDEQICDEDSDACWACAGDADCADGLFCNGEETCSNEHLCAAGTSPCSGDKPFCLENTDQCVECLVDEDCDEGKVCISNLCQEPPDCLNHGMVWKWKWERENPDISYVSCQQCQPYRWDSSAGTLVTNGVSRINTSCSETFPILCIREEDSLPPPNLETQYEENRWAEGHIALSAPIVGCSLTSLATANQICETQLGTGYRMASFHDGGGWAMTAYGHLNQDMDAGAELLTFWVYIRDQDANCWDSSDLPQDE